MTHHQTPNVDGPAAFMAWARENAITMDAPIDGLKADIERLAPLDEALKDKRVVFLGEEDHWVHEKAEYRMYLLRYLVSRGWHFISEELGWPDGVRTDRYIQSGQEQWLEMVATYGYKGDTRTDREDKPTGLLKDSSANYPVEAFKREQTRQARLLHQLNIETKGKIRCFGFDIDVLAGGGYRDAAEILQPFSHTEEGRKLTALLQRVPKETVEQEIRRLEKLLSMLKKDRKVLVKLSDEAFTLLGQHILNLVDGLEFIRVAHPAKGYGRLRKAMAEREQAMCRNTDFILSQMGPEGKLVLMGHNRHLSKDMASIKEAGGASAGGRRTPSLGTYINNLLPGKVFSIWMLQGHGKSSQPYMQLENTYTCKPGTLNAMLAEAGPTYLLPTASSDRRAAVLQCETDIVGIYNTVFRTVIARQADAIFFVDEVHPLV